MGRSDQRLPQGRQDSPRLPGESDWPPLPPGDSPLGSSHGPSYALSIRSFTVAFITRACRPLRGHPFSRHAMMIADCAPRVARPRPSRSDWLVYTDAAAAPPSLCAILFRGDSPPCFARTLIILSRCGMALFFRRTNLIFGLELRTLVLFSEGCAPFLRGSRCWIYLDNNCLSSLARGDSDAGVISVLVARF